MSDEILKAYGRHSAWDALFLELNPGYFFRNLIGNALLDPLGVADGIPQAYGIDDGPRPTPKLEPMTRTKCQHCGQWGEKRTECAHCGGPVE